MSILASQRSLRRLGNLRMGTKGDKHPSKLTTWRITSPNKTIIEHVAEQYGGTVTAWVRDGNTPDEWQTITATDTLPVEIPPQDINANQHLMLWQRGGWIRRCNGELCSIVDRESGEVTDDQPCVCDKLDLDEKDRCKPHTSVDFILPDIRGIGVFRLSTTSWNAARELNAAIGMLAGSQARVDLRLEQREVKRQGQALKRFSVPVIDAPISLSELRESSDFVSLGSAPPAGTPALPRRVSDAAGPVAPVEAELGEAMQPTMPPDGAGVTVDTVPSSTDDDVVEGEVVEFPSERAGTGTEAFLEAKLTEATAVLADQWTGLNGLLNLGPRTDRSMGPMREDVRELFRLMANVGLWGAVDDVDGLHLALRKRDVAHLADLRRDDLVGFVEAAWTAAADAVKGME